MRRRFVVTLGALGLTFGMTVPAASAQICGGRAPFNSRPFQLAATAGVASGAHVMAGSGGGGSDRLFAIGSLEHRSDQNGRRYWLDGVFGADQPLTRDNRLHVCPVAGIGYGRSRAADPDRDNAARMSAELRLGFMVANVQSAAVIPTLAVRVGRQWPAAALHPDGGSTSFGAALAGVGLAFTSGFSADTLVALPLHGPERTIMVVATLSYGFARR